MKINELSEMFQSKLRLSIIAMLITGKKTFNELKELTSATDGNLSIQLKKLKEKEFVSEEKLFSGKRKITVYNITNIGEKSFEEYVELLQSILKKRNIDEDNS